MPDEPQTLATPQAGGTGDTSPQAGNTTPSEPQAGDEPISLEEAKKLRSEASNLRKRLKGFEDAEAQRAAAQLSELEKVTKAVEDKEKQIQAYRDQLVQERVKSAALTKGIIDPELAALALKDKLDYGDDGMPTNLDKALDDLLKAKPYLAQQAQQRQASSGGATNPGRQQAATGGQITREFVQNITNAQYVALSSAQKAEVQNLLQQMRKG